MISINSIYSIVNEFRFCYPGARYLTMFVGRYMVTLEYSYYLTRSSIENGIAYHLFVNDVCYVSITNYCR